MCDVRYKITHCLNSEDYFFFKLNEHPVGLEPELRQKPTKRGLTPKVKRLVDNLMYTCDITLPKKIEQKILNNFKEKIEADEGEVIPTLDKIQNYVKGVQRRLRESNDLDHIKKFADEHRYDQFEIIFF